MKKTISAITILFLILTPALGNADYVIRLKNGRQVTTPMYWFEGTRIFFYTAGGTAGMEKAEIDKIEKLETDVGEYTHRTSVLEGKKELPPPPLAAEKANEPKKLPAETEPKAERSLPSQKPPQKIDLKAYQDKMAKLTVDLNKTLARIRKANTNKDLDEKEKATAENRKISAEMWKLTNELKEKNNGELPTDWWAGVGKEEPATQ